MKNHKFDTKDYVKIPTIKKSKLRRLGDITQDLEPLLFELSIDHDLQHGEVVALVLQWLRIHVPEQREEYVAGGYPKCYCGTEKN